MTDPRVEAAAEVLLRDYRSEYDGGTLDEFTDLATAALTAADSVAPTVDRDTRDVIVKHVVLSTQPGIEDAQEYVNALLAAGVGGGDVEWGVRITLDGETHTGGLELPEGVPNSRETAMAACEEAIEFGAETAVPVSRRVGPWLPVEGGGDE